ncbi:glutathione S-transferase family protein [Parachitinimonas caeni]|uniref:Glutathione S-transferase N-terminal domain-containing protein n=1 Tax=Parachitinimonas caeni TaxID=3031301 RepID=A0ABT7DUE0_9NEIS|nr:glutathione S-transferase N-terminal domain-containing protein [Parachitinimonas caeni]MDK2122693.1 glutathione S-transferase N-terminal domain-containing protein [Parachitinimonas caeni]
MLTLYTWNTPNGRKISLMLEECGLPYQIEKIDIMKGDQFTPAYQAISPNGKIPALVDTDGPNGEPFALFESGAILIYLAEKTSRFLPASGPERYRTLQWLMFQMGGFGPMLGQAHHFGRFAPEKIPYAIERYQREANRLYGVLDRELAQRPYIAGEYSIADMALYPWALRHEWQGVSLEAYPAVAAWMSRLAERPAIQRGMAVEMS